MRNIMNNLIKSIEQDYLKKEVPVFNVGDTVKVMVRVIEGEKERLQAFEGIVIAKKGGSIRETFTVRRVSFGVGIERVFHLHSPRIDKVEVIRKGKVRRAKLYYIRALSGKAAKIKEVTSAKTIKKIVPNEVLSETKTESVKITTTTDVKKAEAKKIEKVKK